MRMCKKIIPIFIFVVFIFEFVKPMTANTQIYADKNDLSAFIEKNAIKRGLTGSILVSQNNKTLFQKAYGYKDKENRIKNTVNTIYPIASLTKSFTAVAIMQLEQLHKLSVQDRVSKYLPHFPNGNKITIHELLTHSSGIKEITSIINTRKKVTPEQMIKALEKQKLEFQPGTRYHYSNSNYLLLAYIVQSVSRVNYHNYIKKYIFQKAGMKNSFFQTDSNIMIAKGYEKMKIPHDLIDGTVNFGYGDIVSTVGDMQKYYHAIETYSLLSKKETKKMQIGYIDTVPSLHMQYSYGWQVMKSDITSNKTLNFHSGDLPGYNSEIFFFMNEHVEVVILSNNENSVDLYQFCQDISNRLF